MEKLKSYQITEWSHALFRLQVKEEGFYVGRHLKLSVAQPKEMGDLMTI